VKKLQAGDAAPEFTLRDQAEQNVSLSDFRGQRVLVFFYPRAMTPGCTRQAQAASTELTALRAQNTAVIGISADPPARQARFDDKHQLGFPLLSDPENAVAAAWGVVGEKMSFGVKRVGVIRSAFLVDPQGRIEAAWYRIRPDDMIPRVQDQCSANATSAES